MQRPLKRKERIRKKVLINMITAGMPKDYDKVNLEDKSLIIRKFARSLGATITILMREHSTSMP